MINQARRERLEQCAQFHEDMADLYSRSKLDDDLEANAHRQFAADIRALLEEQKPFRCPDGQHLIGMGMDNPKHCIVCGWDLIGP